MMSPQDAIKAADRKVNKIFKKWQKKGLV